MPVAVRKQTPVSVTKPPVRKVSSGGGLFSRLQDIHDDLDDSLNVLVYGQSGSGKTTFWSTFKGPILALVCSGGKRSGELRSIDDTPEMKKKIKKLTLEKSDEVVEAVALLKGQWSHFNTVVIDHITSFCDLVLCEILGLDQLPAQKSWGMAKQQDYGQMTLQVKEHFKALLDLPQNIVFVAQERTFNSKEDNVDSDLVKPTIGAAVTPAISGWLNPACDYVLQTFKRGKMVEKTRKIGKEEQTYMEREEGIEYCLRTEPHEVYMTKFRIPRGRVLPSVIVDPNYEKLMKVIQGG